MKNPAFLGLSGIGFGFLIAWALTRELWTGIGFFLFAGLAAVLFPREMAGDPENDVGRYAWMLPDSQPARTIVMFIFGVVCVGSALVLILR